MTSNKKTKELIIFMSLCDMVTEESMKKDYND